MSTISASHVFTRDTLDLVTGEETHNSWDYFDRERNVWNKPALTRNPKQPDGYRRPSSYYGEQNAYYFTADVRGERTMYSQGGRVKNDERITGKVLCSVNPTALISPVSIARATQQELRTKILVNLKDEVLDVAMVLAELSSTADTLGTNLMRLARSMDAVKRRKPENFYYLLNGRRRDGRRPTDKFLRESAGTFLEWKYGIMPTVYDIRGATLALDMSADGSLFDNPPLMVARTQMRGVLKREINVPVYRGRVMTTELDCAYQAHARADFSVSGEGLRGLSRYGIGLGSLATVLFDRTPFSFVLNMALPIADLIKAWTSVSAGVNVRGYSETFYCDYKLSDFSGGLKNPSDWQLVDAKAPTINGAFRRYGFDHVPMPLPFIRNPIRIGNLQTGLALFTQLRSNT